MQLIIKNKRNEGEWAMALKNELENAFKKNVNKLLEAFNIVNNENTVLNEELKKNNNKYSILKKDYDENVVSLQDENVILKEKVKEYEVNLKKAVQIEPKIKEFLKSITELKNISGEARNVTIEIFMKLIDEELKVILKLADSFAKRKDKKQIDKESLNHGLKALISSDRLLKKAIELVQKLHFQ